MTPELLVVTVAVMTYASRVSAMAVLPEPTGVVLGYVQRLPVPLFAGLGVFVLVGDPPAVPAIPALAAVAAALVVSPRRSFALVLVAGLSAYAVASLIW